MVSSDASFGHKILTTVSSFLLVCLDLLVFVCRVAHSTVGLTSDVPKINDFLRPSMYKKIKNCLCIKLKGVTQVSSLCMYNHDLECHHFLLKLTLINL